MYPSYLRFGWQHLVQNAVFSFESISWPTKAVLFVLRLPTVLRFYGSTVLRFYGSTVFSKCNHPLTEDRTYLVPLPLATRTKGTIVPRLFFTSSIFVEKTKTTINRPTLSCASKGRVATTEASALHG